MMTNMLVMARALALAEGFFEGSNSPRKAICCSLSMAVGSISGGAVLFPNPMILLLRFVVGVVIVIFVVHCR